MLLASTLLGLQTAGGIYLLFQVSLQMIRLDQVAPSLHLVPLEMALEVQDQVPVRKIVLYRMTETTAKSNGRELGFGVRQTLETRNTTHRFLVPRWSNVFVVKCQSGAAVTV